ncbi:hypothetical protein EDD17DRAFT_1571088 [Pisolithus thermaeus]|nr:hypothetical protein EDD17DRAFT_1571088 [Pisolithus thermaeus]
MIPSDNALPSSDHKFVSKFQKLAGKLHYNIARSPPAPSVVSPCHSDTQHPNYLVGASLPLPGPAHYAARRALWLTPTKVPEHAPSSSSRLRLEQLLSQPGAVRSDEAWKGGVQKVWNGLVGGGRLRRRLPMNLVIKVIHAGWLRDPETWPSGAEVPESEDDPSHKATPPSPPSPLPRLASRQESYLATSKPEDKPLVKHFHDIGEMRSSGLAAAAH